MFNGKIQDFNGHFPYNTRPGRPGLMRRVPIEHHLGLTGKGGKAESPRKGKIESADCVYDAIVVLDVYGCIWIYMDV